MVSRAKTAEEWQAAAIAAYDYGCQLGESLTQAPEYAAIVSTSWFTQAAAAAAIATAIRSKRSR